MSATSPTRSRSRNLPRLFYTTTSILLIGFIVLPLVLIVWMSFFSNKILSFPPEGYTLAWYGRAWDLPAFRDGFLLSLRTSLLATLIAIILGVPASLALVRCRFIGREIVTQILMSPMMVPAIVGGSALFTFFIELEMLTGWQIAGTSVGMIVAHALIALPWMVKLVTTALLGVNPSLEEAARSLGASAMTVFFRITLPVIKSGIIAGALFAFVNSFIDLEKSIFLVSPETTTLQIALISYLEWNFDSTIGAVATVQIALITLLLVVTDRYVKLSRAF